MILDDTYTELETRLYLKMNIKDESLLETYLFGEDKYIYDVNLRERNIINELKNLDHTGMYNKEILESINNLNIAINGEIILYNESYFLNIDFNSLIHNIPEFNIKKDIPIKDIPESIAPYISSSKRKVSYCFSNLKCFLDFVDELKDGFCYNCSKRQYDKFIQDLDNFFKSHDGIFMLKVYINDYFLEFIDKK